MYFRHYFHQSTNDMLYRDFFVINSTRNFAMIAPPSAIILLEWWEDSIMLKRDVII